jgi:hypothetical protein
MAIVHGRYVDHIKIFDDQCSPIRHILATLNLCGHRGTYLTPKEHWQKEYDSRPTSYPRLVK